MKAKRGVLSASIRMVVAFIAPAFLASSAFAQDDEPLNFVMTAICTFSIRGPAYVCHDGLKTVAIPFAAIYYYSNAEDEAAEPAGDDADTTGEE